MDPEFDRYIDEFMAKYSTLAKMSDESIRDKHSRKTAIKGSVAGWIACFQAMRLWPSIEPEQIRCPTLIVAGSKNKSVIHWIDENRNTIARTRIKAEILPGLNHPKEFTQIDQFYPVVTKFFNLVLAGQ